jgi:hypothetical protein
MAPRGGPATALLALGACAGALLLAGCGGSTKTVTVASTPTANQANGAPATTSTPATTATTSTSATQATTSTGANTTPSTTRTAPEPAFAEHEHSEHEAGGEGASAAAAVVRARGYTPNDTSQYHSNQTLRVLVGTRSGSADGYDQRAFFFVDGRYIGTDASEASATLKVLAQSDTSVTLGYPLYRSGDPLCCPGGGQASVRFELDNGKLVPTSPIPPSRSSSGLSRN